MASTPAGPGKTSPRLLADFLIFDPLSSGRSNTLTEPAPIQGDVNYTSIQPNACRHEYLTKLDQSSLPPLDDRANEHTTYKIAVVCRRCRVHADLVIDYRRSTSPCPTSDFPLHHFQRLPELDLQDSSQLRAGWQCSSPACSACLTVTHKVQRLRKDDILLLTDTARLKQRYEDVVNLHPEREGIKQTTPVEAALRLRKYLKDSLNPEHTKRTFPAANKRFMEAFGAWGRDCGALLQELGFTYSEADVTWTLPNPAQDGSARQWLQDVELELLLLADKIAKDTNASNPAVADLPNAATRDLERVLSAQGYPRWVSSLRSTVPGHQEACFASLGAMWTFADSVVIFCFDRQSMCDVDNQAYYFECLQEIASFRNSEELHMKASILASEGYLSRRELNEAYDYFSLPRSGANTDDARIINIYQARQSDLAPAEAERARAMLYRIGSSRGSKLLINAAQQKIETVDEALAWLGNGVDHNTTDEALLNVLALRVDGDKTRNEIGRRAIEVIAQARHSQQLRTWLDTGRTDGYTMSVDEALRHLDISQALDGVDPTLWPTIFENARSSRSGDQTEKAIAAIQQALSGMGPDHTPSDWPVGLTSHGNTCYLNSLLQYYFSIKPLRDIVLNYEKYKFDLDLASEKTQRVGQRQISLLEIKGGQRFAEDLRHLFVRMITDPSTSVKPEQDLVCRAFLDPGDSDLWDNKDKNMLDKTKSADSALPSIAEDVADAAGPTPNDKPGDDSMEVQQNENLIDLDDNAVSSSPTTLTDAAMNDAPMTPPASPKVRADSPDRQPPPLPPRKFSITTNAALERAQSNATQQQDVTEVHDGIQFRLRAGLRADGQDSSGEQIDDLLKLFSIHLAETTVKDGKPLKPQALTDSAIQLNVPSTPTDIYSALDAIFDQQPVEGSEHLERYKSISRLPPFLQINIPRVGFDKDKGEQFKSEHSIKLVDELYLDRYYVDANDSLLERRRYAWEWRKELTELKKEQASLEESSSGLTGPAAVAETAEFLANLGTTNEGLAELGISPIENDTDLVVALEELAKEQAARSVQLNQQTTKLQSQIDNLFKDLRGIKYRLQAVFFHRGKTAHGHYWICIRDFSSGMWRRYNDERVEEVPEAKVHEIFEANEWAHGTPTYAVYVRDDIKVDVVQPVCRELAREEDTSTAQVEVETTEADSAQAPPPAPEP